MRGKKISGSFNQEELLQTNQDIFHIEKVIGHDKKKALVKWSGYPDKFESWVPLSDLQKLKTFTINSFKSSQINIYLFKE